MAKDHGCCCCALVLLFSLVAVVVVAVVLGLKFGRPLSDSDSAKVTLTNATTAVSSNSNTTTTTLIPPIKPTGEVVTLVSNSSKMLTTSSMMSTAESLTTPSNDKDCGSRNSSCVECIGNVKCYYCYKDNTCRLYPASAVLPTSECPLSQVRWGATCDVSFEVLVIAVSVVGAVLVLALCCCCCCCCSRKSQKGGCGGLRCCSSRSCCRSSGSGRHTWRDFKWSRDNRSNQMNPNNWRFWKARGDAFV